MITNTDEKNFILYAAKHYDNPHCSDIAEFYSDLAIPLHLKKLFTRYLSSNTLKERLIVNHVISIFNVFPPEAAIKILFYKLDPKHWSQLKAVLFFLNRCPDIVSVNGVSINIAKIEIDHYLLERLRNI